MTALRKGRVFHCSSVGLFFIALLFASLSFNFTRVREENAISIVLRRLVEAAVSAA